MSQFEEDFAKELAKNIPVKKIYKDGCQPSIIQTGIMIEDLTKVLMLALAPVQFLAALQDRYREFLDQSIRAVPEKKRISPAPQILGPVIEGIKYETDNTALYNMFSDLLSNAMDEENYKDVHPSFPLILKQLSCDEAIILQILLENKRVYHMVYQLDLIKSIKPNGKPDLRFENLTIIEDTFPTERITIPEKISFYINHLHQMGLASMLTYEEDPILDNKGVQIGIKKTELYTLSEFGKEFIKACTRN